MSENAAGERYSEPETLTVLLVEDDDGDARLVQDELLERLPKARLLRSRTLAEAVQALKGRIDCVLLDLGLPDATGIDAVSKLRAATAAAPLIVLTGLDDEAAGLAAVAAGAQDYLLKGNLDHQQLPRSIRYAIGRRQAEENERELLLAEAQAREVARLERGLAPTLVLEDSPIWVESCYRAGRSRALLGGDFFDLVQDEDGHIHVVVGDVCGHGPDEAAIGVTLRAAWRALALSGASPEVLLGTMEQVLERERHLPGLFATLCTLRWEQQPTRASMIRAGHPRPLLIADGSVSLISDAEKGGAGIGMAQGGWLPELVALPEDWTMLIYTDGIIDARVGGGSARLGEEGLQALLSEQMTQMPDWRERPRKLLERLVEEAEQLNGQGLSDDVAMLLLGADTQTLARTSE
ncbi:MAG TPA: SpoIIE family protein phosphatase [Solirubrobacteraceae bacterium]|nr:SpoIIE family protein phosphatase [Solirubrobacteraceae bacterium]